MGAVLNLSIQLRTINCGVCGGTYAINERKYTWCQEYGKSWNCPYCQCGWGFTGNGEVDQLKKELAAEQQRKNAALARENEERRQRVLAEDKLKKQTRRVAAGTCPCCKRTFKQLAAHMKNKHPEVT